MFKRMLGLILAMCMVLDIMPLSTIAASNKRDVISLPTGMPQQLLESDKAGGVFIMGTQNATVEEKGHIEVKIYRTGKSDEKASISLNTVDIGALYGKDYCIDDDRYDIDKHPADKTLYEQSVTPERREKLNEYRKSLENTMNYLSGETGKENKEDKSGEEENKEDKSGEKKDNKENNAADKSTSSSALDVPEKSDDENADGSSYDEMELADYADTAVNSISNILNSEAVSEEKQEDTDKEDTDKEAGQPENEKTDDEKDAVSLSLSGIKALQTGVTDEDFAAPPSLASLKAAQTGLPTREAENADNNYDAMVEELIGGVAKEGIGSFIDTSAETVLTFEPGETEKTIILEILEDDESEGDEIFSIELSDPSENSELGQPARCVISIKDDEPTVYPKLSFIKETFQASGDGTATIRVKRDGAPYTLCTATVETGEGALSGLRFEPFEMEKTVNITATKDSGPITVKLGNLAGAEEGDLMEATVNPPKDKSLLASSVSNKDGEASLAAASTNTERTINIKSADGGTKAYTVKYNLNDPMGTIYDDNNYAVGDYYFPNDKKSGGIWEHYADDSTSCTYRESKYYPGNSGRDAYMHLNFYTPMDWEMGGASMHGDIPFKKYSGFSIEWQQDSHSPAKGGEVNVHLGGARRGGIRASNYNLGKKTFSRCMSEVYPALYGDNVIPNVGEGSLSISFEDSESTPVVSPLINCDGYVYGVAAFYQRYQLNLLQPSKVNFRTSEGRYIAHTPAQASLQIGHETRWAGQTATIESLPATQEDGVYCYLDHYIITTGEATDKKVSFTYYPAEHPDENGNIHYDSLPFDQQWFIDLIDENRKEVTKDHLGYHTKLTINPIYLQKDAVVRVFDGVYEGENNVNVSPGGFTLDDLKPGVHVLKQGDEIDLRATPSTDNFFLRGTEVWLYDSYYNYTDSPDGCHGIGGPKYHATLWSDSRIMTYTLKDAYMEIKPIFSDSVNYIAVRGIDEKDTVLEELSKDEIKSQYKALTGRDAPDWMLKERIVALNPPVGELFNINIVQKNPIELVTYRRQKYYLTKAYMIAQGKDDPGEKNYKEYSSFGSSFDVEVKASAEENTVWAHTSIYKEMPPYENSFNCMEALKIKGRVTTSGVTLLSSANYNQRKKKIGTPVAGAVVSAGGYQSKIYNKKKYREEDTIYRYTATTDEDGYFELTGEFCLSQFSYWNRNVDLRIDAGGMSTKYKLYISDWRDADITYTETTLDKNNNITTKTITERGYDCTLTRANYGKEKIYDFELPVASLTTPEPTRIRYEFTKPTSYSQGADTRNTSVPILDDEVIFTLYADRRGKNIKRAEFIVNHEKGEPTVFEAPPEKDAPNVFIWKLNMTEAKENEQLMNNDFLTVRLVDADDETYTSSMWDSVTGETATVTQTREMVYLPVHTGLSFSDVSVKPFVQTWEFEANDTLKSVPVFDNLIPNATSGRLNIKKKDIEAGLERNPYVIQVGFDISYGNKAAKSPEDILKTANNYCKNSTALGLSEQMADSFKSGKWDTQIDNLRAQVEKAYTNKMDEVSKIKGDPNSNDDLKKIVHDMDKEAKGIITDRAKANAKNSITQMNKAGIKYKTGFNFVLADTYVYDKDTNKYVSVGCQYSVGASASVSGTH